MTNLGLAQQISEAITPFLESQEAQLQESIEEVRAMFAHEDRGWELIGKAQDNPAGLDLDEVHTIARKARVKVAASALPKRAVDLHAGYVFGNGVEIEGTLRTNKRGKPSGLVSFFEDPINQESLFSGAAKRELQYARFTDGNVVVFCYLSEKRVRRIPITDLAAVLVSPDHPDEIWAWMRQWNHTNPDGYTEVRKEWVYTNRFPGTPAKSIVFGTEAVPVNRSVVAVDLRCNRQVGWRFGVPDAVAGLHWSEAYGEVLRYGQIVNESLAKIVYKVTNTNSKKGAANVGLKISTPGIGKGVALGEGQDIQLVNSTQRSFDFAAARPLAAMAAAAWNVSNIDLLSDSSAAGSSYGAAQSLTPGMQNAMNVMRDEWTQFYQDILEVFGFGRPIVHWPPMEKPDSYRMAQELTLYSIALTDQEYRSAVLDRLDIPGDPSEIPDSLKQRVQPSKQAASPDQGQSNGTGGQDSAQKSDQRSDVVGETLAQMRQEDFLDDLRNLVERLEVAKR